MPKEFEDCVKKGGVIKTITLPNNKYRHICTIGGKTTYGEIKTKKEDKKDV
jgi:hypothetical protein